MLCPFFAQPTEKDEDSDIRSAEFKFQSCPNLIFPPCKIQGNENK